MAQVVSGWLLDRGPHSLDAFVAEIPNFVVKRALRRLLDLAPPDWMTNLLFLTPPVRALAQRIYFHRRSGGGEEFDAWQRDFERQSFEPQPPGDKTRRRLIAIT